MRRLLAFAAVLFLAFAAGGSIDAGASELLSPSMEGKIPKGMAQGKCIDRKIASLLFFDPKTEHWFVLIYDMDRAMKYGSIPPTIVMEQDSNGKLIQAWIDGKYFTREQVLKQYPTICSVFPTEAGMGI